MTQLSKPLGHLMVDVQGHELTQDEKKFLAHDHVGAVILFSRNYANREQLCQLVKQIKQIRNPSLLIAVDQEGGRIQRFREGFSPLPSPADFEAYYHKDKTLGLELAFTGAALMASEILACDIDFSFAPLLDIGNAHSDVLAKRTFADQADTVIDIGKAFIDGMNAAGMQATGKHFPGHGGVQGDSHLQTPEDNRQLDDLLTYDLQPFTQLRHKLGAVMTAHVAFKNIDSELPTFSHYWLSDILRNNIGFKGVIFSDDLIMQGAHVAGDIVERCHKTFQAGCDMALICNDPEAARKAAHELKLDHIVDIEKSRQRLESMRPQSRQDNLANIDTLQSTLAGHGLINL